MYLLALKIAVIAYVYSVILTEPGMVLSGWYRFLLGLNLPEWIFKPLIDCYKCVAGQFALWTIIIGFIIKWYFVFVIINWIFIICSSILLVIIIDKIWNLKK